MFVKHWTDPAVSTGERGSHTPAALGDLEAAGLACAAIDARVDITDPTDHDATPNIAFRYRFSHKEPGRQFARATRVDQWQDRQRCA
jgi:hypothetical protein